MEEEKLTYEELEQKLEKKTEELKQSQNDRWHKGNRIKDLEKKLGDTHATEGQLNSTKADLKAANERNRELQRELEKAYKEKGAMESERDSAKRKQEELKGVIEDQKEKEKEQIKYIEHVESLLNEYITAVQNVNTGVAAALSNGKALQETILAKFRGDN